MSHIAMGTRLHALLGQKVIRQTPEVFQRAADLPAAWDEQNNGNPFLKKTFLSLMEGVNPCKQKYVVFKHAGQPNSILVMYEFGLNLLSFLTNRLRFIVNAKFIYVPLSVDASGIVVGEETREQVFEFLRKEKGLKIILNPEGGLTLPGFIRGVHMPTHKMDIRPQWKSFDKYLKSMKSGHRHQCNSALKKGKALVVDECGPEKFNSQMYGLYLQVWEHAEHKLEKLSLGFFQKQPAKFLRFLLDGKCVGFVQLLGNGEELIFEFCGFDYNLNKDYSIYVNMLLAIVRYGIEHGYKKIDFGQTTDELKMKIGCVEEDRHILIGHSNPAINWILKKVSGLLSYKKLKTTFDVFKVEVSAKS